MFTIKTNFRHWLASSVLPMDPSWVYSFWGLCSRDVTRRVHLWGFSAASSSVCGSSLGPPCTRTSRRACTSPLMDASWRRTPTEPSARLSAMTWRQHRVPPMWIILRAIQHWGFIWMPLMKSTQQLLDQLIEGKTLFVHTHMLLIQYFHYKTIVAYISLIYET